MGLSSMVVGYLCAWKEYSLAGNAKHVGRRLGNAHLKRSQKAPVYYIVGVFQVQQLNALHSRQLPRCLGPKPVQLKAKYKTRGGEGFGPTRSTSGRIVVQRTEKDTVLNSPAAP